MDDYKIRILLTALRTGSFRKGAAELSCTQSAVTQAMNSLEDELGCRILQRGHNGIRLTPAGEELLPLVIEADASLTRLAKRARQVSAGIAAPLRIGAFSSIASTWLPKVLQEYHTKRNKRTSADAKLTTPALRRLPPVVCTLRHTMPRHRV